MNRLIPVALCCVVLSACQSAYYAAWEKFGIEKRDILVDRVEDARDAQQQAQTQFSSALDEFSQLVDFDGGELENLYSDLKNQYDASKASADRVSGRIDKVESVAGALFDEWKRELRQYSRESLRRDSARKLKDTQQKYATLVSSMRRAEAKMAPVLTALNDNVLYLKHNLNASAISALKGEFAQIKGDIDLLLIEMKTAIEESNRFISALQGR